MIMTLNGAIMASIYETGPSCDEQAQATMTAKLVRGTDEIASWAEQPTRRAHRAQALPRPVGINDH